MNFIPKAIIPIILLVSLFSCQEKESLTISVTNPSSFDRSEIVSIAKNDLVKFLNERDETGLLIKKQNSEVFERIQWLDLDQNGDADELLFQAVVPASSTETYEVTWQENADTMIPESDVIAYSRFVPERTDDYTWENDKVAFRTYGPTGQKEALAGVNGSTLSSGIDLWLKRTDVSVINKWYAEHVKAPGYYHKDHGEGYDPYHVGGSRGTGGSAIWQDDSLYVSENYVAYRTLADGPLRTVFELDYPAWGPFDLEEVKRITLDLGSNFSKYEISLSSDTVVSNYAVGITLHENKGSYDVNTSDGWIAHWEQIDDSFVGEGLVMAPAEIDTAFARVSKVPDQSNLLIVTQPKDQLTYYAGFGWVKSGQIDNQEDWEIILDHQAEIIANPFMVKLNK